MTQRDMIVEAAVRFFNLGRHTRNHIAARLGDAFVVTNYYETGKTKMSSNICDVDTVVEIWNRVLRETDDVKLMREAFIDMWYDEELWGEWVDGSETVDRGIEE